MTYAILFMCMLCVLTPINALSSPTYIAFQKVLYRNDTHMHVYYMYVPSYSMHVYYMYVPSYSMHVSVMAVMSMCMHVPTLSVSDVYIAQLSRS